MAKRRSVVAGWDPTHVNPDSSTGRPKGVQTVSDMRVSLTYDVLGEGIFATKGIPEITGSPTNIATISPFMAAIASPAGGYYTPSTTADENIEINLLNVGAVKIYVQQKDYEVDNAAVDSEVVFGVVYGATAIPEGALLLFTSTLSGQTSTSLMTFTPAFKYTGQASGMIRVPTIDDLANITSIQNGTHGFVIDGDGIGEYSYDSASNSWPAVTGTTNGVVINVKDFGARGNGVNDDTAEIQAAVDAASAAGGGEVFFPRGLYVISASIKLKSSVNMTGVGMSNGGSSNLAASRGTTIKQITASEDGFYLETNGAAVGYIRIEDMSILGAGYSTSTANGININQATDHTILHVYISAVTVRGFGLWGISAEALINSVIEKCLVAYNGNGINVFGRAGWPTTSTVVRSNYLNWNLGIGVRFNYTDYSSIVENASDHQDIHYQIGLFTSEVLSALPSPTIAFVMPDTVPVNVGDSIGAFVPIKVAVVVA